MKWEGNFTSAGNPKVIHKETRVVHKKEVTHREGEVLKKVGKIDHKSTH